MVLAMGTQMLGELVDALGEQRDLDLGPAGVRGRGAELLRPAPAFAPASGSCRRMRLAAQPAISALDALDVTVHLLHQRLHGLKSPLAAQPGQEVQP